MEKQSKADLEKKLSEFKKMLEGRQEKVRIAREESPLTKLSSDYFARFIRDRSEMPANDEIVITDKWKIVYNEPSSVVLKKMIGHLQDFFKRCMKIDLLAEEMTDAGPLQIELTENGGVCSNKKDGFSICTYDNRINIAGNDPGGLRDAIVRFINILGLRCSPYVKKGEVVYTPLIEKRIVGLQDIKNDIFYGANTVLIGGCDLYAISVSDAIPELAVRRRPEVIKSLIENAKLAREYGLSMYIHVSIQEKFDGDDPLFDKYPDIKGALTWKEDGQYTLCTEHPLVIRFLAESVEGLFRSIPDLDGITVIIGGEGFYHCFMRAYGTEKGHTNCKRCEPLGAERVVADLCNSLAEAAQKINPNARINAWPYSASYVWSADFAQEAFMRLLSPSVAIMTEFEKDEAVVKPGGIEKLLWDYSIDLIGPDRRAAIQLKVSRETNVPVIVLSMAEMSFEAPLQPFIPVHDRWIARSKAIANSGANGIYLWNMAPFNGLSTGELYQYYWFSPSPEKEDLLKSMAKRITGNGKAGDLLRNAWREASNGFDFIPTIPSYYSGPHYLGPAHPVVIDPNMKISEVFKGYYLFLAEASPESALEPLDVYRLHPETIGGYSGPQSVPVLETHYRVLEKYLERAKNGLDEADPLIPDSNKILYRAETLPVRWFYHTARTLGNIYELFSLIGILRQWANSDMVFTDKETAKAKNILSRFREILINEKQNVLEAIPIADEDPRIETLHRGDHSFSAMKDMLSEKLSLLDHQISKELPYMETLSVKDFIKIYVDGPCKPKFNKLDHVCGDQSL